MFCAVLWMLYWHLVIELAVVNEVMSVIFIALMMLVGDRNNNNNKILRRSLKDLLEWL